MVGPSHGSSKTMLPAPEPLGIYYTGTGFELSDGSDAGTPDPP